MWVEDCREQPLRVPLRGHTFLCLTSPGSVRVSLHSTSKMFTEDPSHTTEYVFKFKCYRSIKTAQLLLRYLCLLATEHRGRFLAEAGVTRYQTH